MFPCGPSSPPELIICVGSIDASSPTFMNVTVPPGTMLTFGTVVGASVTLVRLVATFETFLGTAVETVLLDPVVVRRVVGVLAPPRAWVVGLLGAPAGPVEGVESPVSTSGVVVVEPSTVVGVDADSLPPSPPHAPTSSA